MAQDKQIIIEFGEKGKNYQRIAFKHGDPENGGSTTTSVVTSTLFNLGSRYVDRSHVDLFHAVIAQHINHGIDVTSEAYRKGLEMGLTWYLFHQSR